MSSSEFHGMLEILAYLGALVCLLVGIFTATMTFIYVAVASLLLGIALTAILNDRSPPRK